MEKAKEELVAIDKDITVLSMLIDGTLPDDMKKQGKFDLQKSENVSM